MPAALAGKEGRQLGDIAVLYRNKTIGDVAAIEARRAKLPYLRIDNAAPYKKVPLTSWIEDCATWCAGGWKTASPAVRDLQGTFLSFHGRRSDRSAREACALLTRHRRAASTTWMTTFLSSPLPMRSPCGRASSQA